MTEAITEPLSSKVENKKSVRHDIPVTFHQIHFVPVKKPNQKLSGEPSTLIKFEDVMTLITDYEFHTVELESRDRYTYNFSGIRLNKSGIYECVINCDDSQAEDVLKHNKKIRKTEIVSFNVDESHLIRAHVLFQPLASTEGVCARMLIEGNRKISEQVVRMLLQKIIDQIEKSAFQPDFFKEDYAGTLPNSTKQYQLHFSIKTKTDPITDQEFIKQLESGQFYHIQISEKTVGKVHTEAPFLNETLQTIQLKPVFTDGSKGIGAIFTGLKKLAKKKFGTDTSKETKEITYKLCYPEGSHKRTVSFNPTNEQTSDFAIKRKWINKFERQNKTHDTIFDNDLCRRMTAMFKDEGDDHDTDDN